jgi:transcriptional regulator with XRE-family HTH domain
MDNYSEIQTNIVHIWTMLKTSTELLQEVANGIRARRLSMDFSQQEAAQRSGIAYRTWRRLETEGKASVKDLIKAAIALRCEENLGALFPVPSATSLDELLKQQAKAATAAANRRSRVARRRAPP